jgi:hypothetical protein
VKIHNVFTLSIYIKCLNLPAYLECSYPSYIISLLLFKFEFFFEPLLYSRFFNNGTITKLFLKVKGPPFHLIFKGALLIEHLLQHLEGIHLQESFLIVQCAIIEDLKWIHWVKVRVCFQQSINLRNVPQILFQNKILLYIPSFMIVPLLF